MNAKTFLSFFPSFLLSFFPSLFYAQTGPQFTVNCISCTWTTAQECEQTFSIPLAKDTFDGIQDGIEVHRFFGDIRDGKMMKVNQINGPECDLSPYQTVFMDDFTGTSLNETAWIIGYNHPAPYDVLGNDENHAIVLPGLTKVENGLLNLEYQFFSPPHVHTYQLPNGTTATVERKVGAGGISSNNTLSLDDESGCLRYGRYSISAKLPTIYCQAAFWFYGWAGEIDIFETCMNRRANERNCSVLDLSLHQWGYTHCDLEKNQYRLLHEQTDGHSCGKFERNTEVDIPQNWFTSTFVTYGMEWTPYKIVWLIDDEPVFTFYRYYEWNSCGYATGLECWQIPKGQPLANVWEHLGWNRFAHHGMNLILSPNAVEDKVDNQSDLGDSPVFSIDWIKIEQKLGGIQLSTPNFGICDGDVAEFEVELPAGYVESDIVSWNHSSNLILESTQGNTLQLQANGNGSGFVEAEVDIPGSCFNMTLREEVTIGPPSGITVSSTYQRCHGFNLKADIPPNVGTVTWKVTPAVGPEYYVYNTNTILIDQPDPSIPGQLPYVRWVLTVTNSCGESVKQGTLWFEECNMFAFTAHPNPTTGAITFALKKNDLPYITENVVTVTLLDGNLTALSDYEYNAAVEGTIHLGALPVGDYYLSTLVEGQQIISAKIIKQ